MTADADAFVLLDALFANAPVGLAFWDLELRYRRVNAALAATNGIAPGDHVGATPTELLGSLGAEVEAIIRTVLQHGVPRLEVPFGGETPASPGERRNWNANFYPVHDAEGSVLGVGGVIVEVTRELSAERERQATSALLDAIFAAAPVGIAFWDADLRYRRINQALAEMNGVPPEEHLGRRPDEVLDAALGGDMLDLLRRCVGTREALVDQELERTRPDGTRQYRHTTVFPVLDPRGQVAGVAGVVRDVTAQHAAQVERTRLLREALTARAAAEAAQVRSESARAEAEAARRRTDFLAAAGARLAVVTRDYETTLAEVARVCVPDMADWAILTLVDPRGVPRTVAASAGDPADAPLVRAACERDRPRIDAPRGVGRVLRTGASVFLAEGRSRLLDELAVDDEHRALLAQLGPCSGMVVPLRVRDRTTGALTLAYGRSDRRYGPDDLRMSESLGNRAALSVENARLYTERSDIARTLQRSLLPAALPEVPGMELAAGYRAAGEQNEVGGDFYDVFPSGSGAWTVVLGDVSGKGAEAAALTSLTRHTLRAAALRTGDLIESLRLLNDALVSQSDVGGRFSTVLLAQVRPDERGADVRLATGGHLPPMLLCEGGRVERAELKGAIVGGLRDASFGERRLRLDPGDLMLLHTDGLTELRVPGRRTVQSGEAELERVLREHAGASAAQVVAAVERRAVELQGGDPRDDIALMAVRARP